MGSCDVGALQELSSNCVLCGFPRIRGRRDAYPGIMGVSIHQALNLAQDARLSVAAWMASTVDRVSLSLPISRSNARTR